MKPRTVFVTLEIRECEAPLSHLRDKTDWQLVVNNLFTSGNVVQVQVNVAQPTKEK